MKGLAVDGGMEGLSDGCYTVLGNERERIRGLGGGGGVIWSRVGAVGIAVSIHGVWLGWACIHVLGRKKVKGTARAVGRWL